MDWEDAKVLRMPLGCLTGLLALVPLAVAAIGGYGIWVWNQLPESKKHGDHPPLTLTTSVNAGLGVGIPLVLLAFWIYVKTRRAGSD